MTERGAVQEMKDGWPFGVALLGETSNHLMLRWLKTVVVSDEEKAPQRRQVGTGKASVSEPLLTRRDQQTASKPGPPSSPGTQPGGCPLIGQVVPGVKAARARSAASARNVGRRVPTPVDRHEGVPVGEQGARQAAETVRR